MEKNPDLAPSAPPTAPAAAPAYSHDNAIPAVPVAVAVEAQPYHEPGVVQPEANPPQQTLLPPQETNFDGKEVPDFYTKCPTICCACRYDNLDFPSCFGCKGNCQCLCLEEETFCCKCITHDRTCFICLSRSIECVSCNTACKCYRQCFCCEVVWGLPFETAFVDTNIMFKNIPDRDGSSVLKDAIICNAFCCAYDNCYCKFPECCSGYQKSACLCCEAESICCRAMCFDSTKSKANSLCICDKGHCFLAAPTTICKGVSQCCCLDHRCACPCDEDVPCAFTCLPFCTCCFNWVCQIACCQTIGGLRGLRGGPQ